jgi:hypothetical protein
MIPHPEVPCACKASKGPAAEKVLRGSLRSHLSMRDLSCYFPNMPTISTWEVHLNWSTAVSDFSL